MGGRSANREGAEMRATIFALAILVGSPLHAGEYGYPTVPSFYKKPKPAAASPATPAPTVAKPKPAAAQYQCGPGGCVPQRWGIFPRLFNR